MTALSSQKHFHHLAEQRGTQLPDANLSLPLNIHAPRFSFPSFWATPLRSIMETHFIRFPQLPPLAVRRGPLFFGSYPPNIHKVGDLESERYHTALAA